MEWKENVLLETQCGMFYQYNGATWYFVGQVINFLNLHFPERWIEKGDPVLWPARSSDLSLLDCFRSCLRARVYNSGKPNTREELIKGIVVAADTLRNELAHNGTDSLASLERKDGYFK